MHVDVFRIHLQSSDRLQKFHQVASLVKLTDIGIRNCHFFRTFQIRPKQRIEVDAGLVLSNHFPNRPQFLWLLDGCGTWRRAAFGLLCDSTTAAPRSSSGQ